MESDQDAVNDNMLSYMEILIIILLPKFCQAIDDMSNKANTSNV